MKTLSLVTFDNKFKGRHRARDIAVDSGSLNIAKAKHRSANIGTLSIEYQFEKWENA